MDAIAEAIKCEENKESLFDARALARDGFQWEVSDDFVSALRKSAGLRFLLLSNFHDAGLVSYQNDTVYGKNAIKLTIDFSGVFSPLKEKVRICEVCFIDAETEFDFEEISDFRTCVGFLGGLLKENGSKFTMEFDIYVAKPDRGYEDKLKIDFSIAVVRDVTERKRKKR